LKGKPVLVTGGAGFCGSMLVANLIAEGAKVIVLDDLFTGDLDNLPNHEDIEFVEGSVDDYDLIKKLTGKVDVVFHLAARNIIASTQDPRGDYRVNIGGTFNVLLAARETGNVQKVVYSSSASVYGNPRYLPINEDDRINTLTPYSVSKLAGECYCISFYESYGLPVAVVRYSNVYGINQQPTNPYCGVVSKFFDRVSHGQPPQIHGDGEQTRDFTFIEDTVEATTLVALSNKSDGEVFNVGTGVEHTVNNLAQSIIGLYDQNMQPEYVDKRDIDNIRRRILNIEKIRKMMRWTPRFTLVKGLEKTKAWYESSVNGENH
jgi:UDP-glucose 4-epimerase